MAGLPRLTKLETRLLSVPSSELPPSIRAKQTKAFFKKVKIEKLRQARITARLTKKKIRKLRRISKRKIRIPRKKALPKAFRKKGVPLF